uniref:ATP-binding protein n=1 Tax=Steinernema glaseri TaxID=37863 RepID=A0A1I8ANP1_9BILA
TEHLLPTAQGVDRQLAEQELRATEHAPRQRGGPHRPARLQAPQGD